MVRKGQKVQQIAKAGDRNEKKKLNEHTQKQAHIETDTDHTGQGGPTDNGQDTTRTRATRGR